MTCCDMKKKYHLQNPAQGQTTVMSPNQGYEYEYFVKCKENLID